MFTKSAIQFPQPQVLADDPRLKNIIESRSEGAADVVLVGVPFDGGIANGGGRIGAAHGPDAFRNGLLIHGSAYNIDRDCDLTSLKIRDAGNIEFDSADIHAVHRSVTEAIRPILNEGITPFLVGGGHDLTFAHVRAMTETLQGSVGGINIDGHLDVRPTLNGQPSSGTPLRRILDELPNINSQAFVEFGAHGNLTAKEHVEYLKAKGASLLTLNAIREAGVERAFQRALEIAGKADHVFISFDIDSAAQAFSPGCSAPSADGFFPADVEQMGYLAGLHPKVRMIDMLEFNPKYDIDNRTARLAISFFAHVLAGLAQRRTTQC